MKVKRSLFERVVVASLLIIMVIQLMPLSLLGQEVEIDMEGHDEPSRASTASSVEVEEPESYDDHDSTDIDVENSQSEDTSPNEKETASPKKIKEIKALPDKAILEKFELEYSEETKAENSRSKEEDPEFAGGRTIAFDT